MDEISPRNELYMGGISHLRAGFVGLSWAHL